MTFRCGALLASSPLLFIVALTGCGAADPAEAPPAATGSGGVGGDGGEATTGGAGAVAGGGGAGAGGSSPDGTWANPFLIDAVPFTDARDTASALSNEASSYAPCDPTVVEGGPEIVYRLSLAQTTWLSASVDDGAAEAVDVDVHLLADADPGACVTRDDAQLGALVPPGDYWIVVDTWTDASNAGAYELSVDASTDDGGDCATSPIACDEAAPPFVNLVGEEAPGDPGCLPGMTRIEDFCVDRFEAIVVIDTPEGWTPASPFTAPPANATLAALSIEGMIPQGHISQVRAADACENAGKRLCDDTEWLRACEGASGTTYPYGDTLQPGVCNDERACHPVIQLFESTEPWIWSELQNACIAQLPAGLAATGEHPACVTEEGAFDMMGNLHEWTADPAGTFRGGFYVDTSVNGSGCHYATTAHTVTHFDYSTGFRCCADAI